MANTFCFGQRFDGKDELIVLLLVATLLGLTSFMMAYVPNMDAVQKADEADHQEHEANKKKLHDEYLKKNREKKLLGVQQANSIVFTRVCIGGFLGGIVWAFLSMAKTTGGQL